MRDNIKDTLEDKARLAEIMLNEKTPITLGGKQYEIGALTYYAKWKISSLITKMEVVNSDISSLVSAMANNVPVLAEIVAIGILVKREKIDSDELEKLKFSLLDSVTDGNEWANAIGIMFKKLDCSFFFGLMEMVKAINSMSPRVDGSE